LNLDLDAKSGLSESDGGASSVFWGGFSLTAGDSFAGVSTTSCSVSPEGEFSGSTLIFFLIHHVDGSIAEEG
jgi:hypothetical protein